MRHSDVVCIPIQGLLIYKYSANGNIQLIVVFRAKPLSGEIFQGLKLSCGELVWLQISDGKHVLWQNLHNSYKCVESKGFKILMLYSIFMPVIQIANEHTCFKKNS